MKIKFFETIRIGAIMLLFFVINGCVKSDLGPLRDPVEPEEIQISWALTADSMQEATYSTYLLSGGTFKQDNEGNNNFNYWWNAHALDVLVDAYLRTGEESYKPKMKALLDGIKAKNGGTYKNEFIDDMEWLGIASLRAYKATNDLAYKVVAEELWEEIKKGWSDVHGGGITWKTNAPNGKNACSNGPAAILALRLYDIDQKPADLEWAKDIYEWQKNTLVDPITGLVWDNIDIIDGEVVINKNWIFTYNVGTYLGAANELYHFTKDQTYLNDAIKTSESMMTSSAQVSEGVLKNEGQGDGGLFKGILIRYFTLLIENPDLSESKRAEFAKFLKFNAETFYSKGIRRPTLLSSEDWKKQPGTRTDLSTQLSGLMLLEAAAKLEKDNIL
jgi:predicted alpha-1,6-mannanase (GH76 family)